MISVILTTFLHAIQQLL